MELDPHSSFTLVKQPEKKNNFIAKLREAYVGSISSSNLIYNSSLGLNILKEIAIQKVTANQLMNKNNE